MISPVTWERRGRIGVITVDNPPVNALAHPVREGLLRCFREAGSDPAVGALVLTGAGRTFMAGADIREFGKPMQEPGLGRVIDAYERSEKPTVAALHGTPLGGGLEVAMGCHARVADSRTRLGLPEVKLGLLPGAGGTQRLPRLVGVERALDMITSGDPIPAPLARELGLVDEIAERDPVTAAIAYAERVLAGAASARATRDRDEKVEGVDPSIFDRAKERLVRSARGREGPLRCVEAVRGAVTQRFDEGLAHERRLFEESHDSEESPALIHVFFSERAANKIDNIPKTVTPRPVTTAAVVGAGTMGGGIAMNFANAGIPVRILDTDRASLERGLGVVRGNYQRAVDRGRMRQADLEARMDLIEGVSDMEALAAADLVIEAVFEDLPVKQKVFGALDRIMREGAILASNTSTLDIDAIAATTRRPEEVIGTHFFSPANVMRLLEIVRGRTTSADVIASAMALARTIRKVGVLVGNCDGFVGNRMFHEYIRQAQYLVERGALPEQVDRAAYAFGWAMGPLAVSDLAGNDVGWYIRKRHLAEGLYRKGGYMGAVADALCEQGRFGQKTGKGWYRYEAGSRKGLPDPEVEELILRVRREKQVRRRTFEDREILARLHGALVNEGARILDEGIAQRASDIDVIYINGYGYPAWRGGPMYHAERRGLAEVSAAIAEFRNEEPALWPESPLLERLARGGGSFQDAKQAA